MLDENWQTNEVFLVKRANFGKFRTKISLRVEISANIDKKI